MASIPGNVGLESDIVSFMQWYARRPIGIYYVGMAIFTVMWVALALYYFCRPPASLTDDDPASGMFVEAVVFTLTVTFAIMSVLMAYISSRLRAIEPGMVIKQYHPETMRPLDRVVEVLEGERIPYLVDRDVERKVSGHGKKGQTVHRVTFKDPPLRITVRGATSRLYGNHTVITGPADRSNGSAREALKPRMDAALGNPESIYDG